MFELERSIFNDEYMGVSSFITEDEKKYNKMWGPEYIFSTEMELKGTNMELMVEVLMLLRVSIP